MISLTWVPDCRLHYDESQHCILRPLLPSGVTHQQLEPFSLVEEVITLLKGLSD